MGSGTKRINNVFRPAFNFCLFASVYFQGVADAFIFSGSGNTTDFTTPSDTTALTVLPTGICYEEPEIPNGEVAPGCVSGSNFNTSCNITCNEGFILSGIAKATCVGINQTNNINAYGVWDYGDTACTRSPCEDSCQSQCMTSRTCVCRDDICTEVCPTCKNNSECLDFQCRCKRGYEGINGNESICVDINECLDNNTCTSIGQSCINFPGAYQCTCNDNYVPSENGEDCIENFCEPSDCGTNAACYDDSTNDCSCFVGFAGDPGVACFDVDECEAGMFECSDAEICHNTMGSYYCDCIIGYTRSESDDCIRIACPPVAVQCSSLDFLVELCESAMDQITSITFPSSWAGYSVTSDTTCGESTTNANTALGSRACELDGTWSTVTWLMSCGTGLSEVASQPIESVEQRQQVSASLQILTSNPENVDSDDVVLTSVAIANVTNSTDILTTTTATSVISTISNLMESPALDESGQSAELLAQLDRVASLVALNDSGVYKAVSNNVSVLITSGNAMNGGVGITVLVRPNSTKIGFRSDQLLLTNSSELAGSVINGERIQASIHVPELAANRSTLSFNVIGNTNLFRPNNNAQSVPSTDARGMINVPTLVISATVENRNISNLPPDELLTYSLSAQYDNATQDPACVFWVESSRSWSDEGCSLTGSTTDTLTCSCDHLTNFAALLRPRQDISDSAALHIVTIVGCSISMFALGILMLLFWCVPNTRIGRKFQGAFLLLNLSLALLVLNATLLVSEMPFIIFADDYDSISDSCRAIAVILHFCLVASIAWMNCEAVMLFLAVVKPIFTRTRLKDQQVILLSICWGWFMPAVFVGIVSLVDISVYEYPYEDGFIVTCWIDPDYILYLAVIPTVVLISVNLIVYGILTYQLCLKRSSILGKSRIDSKESYRRKLGMNFNIFMMLGLTWIFGFFLPGVENETAALVFAYIFAILNSLQGFFLLLLYVLRNDAARQTFRKEMLTIYEKFGLTSTKSNISSRSGTVNVSAIFENESSHSSSQKSPHAGYVSNIVADTRTIGTYKA